MNTGLTRRGFLVSSLAAGGGLMMGFAPMPGAMGRFSPSPWFTMGLGAVTTVHMVKAEMGQHIGTALAQVLADELELPWQLLQIQATDTGPAFGAMLTTDASVSLSFDTFARAGAAGRVSLVAAGARLLAVPAGDCTALDGCVIHTTSRRKVSYADIVAHGLVTASFTDKELRQLILKPRQNYRLIGLSLPAIDLPNIARGTTAYGIDASVPGMLFGALARPPVRCGARARKINDAPAHGVKGYVQALVLQDPTGTCDGWVMALATDAPAAKLAANSIAIDWDKGPNASATTASLLASAQRLQQNKSAGVLLLDRGRAVEMLAHTPAALTLQATYTTAFALHAGLEPLAALVEERADEVHVYVGTQTPTLVQEQVSRALGCEPSHVVVHAFALGDGTGRRLDTDFIIPAALAARAVGKPVKLIYSPNDDIGLDTARSLSTQTLSAGFDEEGLWKVLDHDIVAGWPSPRVQPAAMITAAGGHGEIDAEAVRGAHVWYYLPHTRVRALRHLELESVVPPGAFRLTGAGYTVWAVESFVDELALTRGQDPVTFRLKSLDAAAGPEADPDASASGGAARLAHVLSSAVDRSGYGTKDLPAHTGMGVAVAGGRAHITPSYVAAVATVSVTPATGAVSVLRLTVVADIGLVINPDGAQAWAESAVLQGLSLALYERADILHGALVVDHAHDYPLLPAAELPELDISFADPPNAIPGSGALIFAVVAPAIANAIAKACGARIRNLPITAEAVKAGIKPE